MLEGKEDLPGQAEVLAPFCFWCEVLIVHQVHIGLRDTELLFRSMINHLSPKRWECFAVSLTVQYKLMVFNKKIFKISNGFASDFNFVGCLICTKLWEGKGEVCLMPGLCSGKHIACHHLQQQQHANQLWEISWRMPQWMLSPGDSSFLLRDSLFSSLCSRKQPAISRA